MRRFVSDPFDPQYRPMGEINTTPLIDVLLVLVIMLIITIPILTHSLKIPLPTGPGRESVLAVNTVSIDRQDRLYWNGAELDRQGLLNQLATAASLADQPVVRFEPDANASYDASAKTIALIKDSGIEKFAFIGNHKFRELEKQ